MERYLTQCTAASHYSLKFRVQACGLTAAQCRKSGLVHAASPESETTVVDVRKEKRIYTCDDTPARQQISCLDGTVDARRGLEQASFTRRKAMHAAAATAAMLAWREQSAYALQPISLANGDTVQAWEFDVPLRVVGLQGSVPGQWAQDFRAIAGSKAQLKLQQRRQLANIYSEITAANPKDKSAARADAVTVGDSWLAPAIRSGALQPISFPQRWRWWELLSPRWRELGMRDSEGLLDSRGQMWAVPYRWGCTLIAVNHRKLARSGHEIRDWEDLLHPSLRGKLGMGESPREALGIAFKTLGLPINATGKDIKSAGLSEAAVAARLTLLRRQVLVASDREAPRSLVAGDISALVGWSEDLAPLALSSSKLQLVTPASGTVLWADMWAVPVAAGKHGLGKPSPLLPLWFELALQPQRVSELNQLRRGFSPLQLPGNGGSRESVDFNVDSQPGTSLLAGVSVKTVANYMPSRNVLAHSEFLEPLDTTTQALYARLIAAAS